jgi:Uma2 family endonuclease
METIMPAVANKGVTLEEFLEMEDPDHILELVNGEVLRMTPPKSRHGLICARFARFIGNFVDEKLGWVCGNDTGVIIPGEKDTLRGVDVGYWSREENPVEPEGYFETRPDLAVEVISPTDRRKETQFKVRQYVESGVKLVWVADPETETITVYSGSMKGVEHHVDDVLDGGMVLPGFSRPVKDFF